MGNTLGLAIDHADDLAHFAHGIADLRKARLRGAAALDPGLDFGRHRACLTGQLADGQRNLAGRRARVVRQFLHFRRDHRKTTPGIARPRRFDGGIQRQHVGLARNHFDRRRHHLHLVHRGGETRHPLAQFDHQIGQSLEAFDRPFDRFAPSVELGLGLLRQQARLVGRIADPRLVGEQMRGDFLQPVEGLEVQADLVRHILDVTGDVTAFDRQRTAIARHCADRMFGHFLDTRRRHGRFVLAVVRSLGLRPMCHQSVNQGACSCPPALAGGAV